MSKIKVTKQAKIEIAYDSGYIVKVYMDDGALCLDSEEYLRFKTQAEAQALLDAITELMVALPDEADV